MYWSTKVNILLIHRQYAKENPKIKIRVTINGQGQDWFENKIIESKETCDWFVDFLLC